MSDYTLLGIPGSPFVRKARVFLAEKGIAHDDAYTHIFPVPDGFERINPMRRVPVLKLASGQHIADTTAICLFLERRHPEPSLYPASDVAFADALMWEEYADTVLAATVGLKVFRPLVLYPMMGKTPDLDDVRKSIDVRLPRIYGILTERLGDREFFCDDRLTVTDIAVATHFVNLGFAGVHVDGDAFPVLRAYVDRMLARPAFAQSIAAETTLMPPATPL